MMESQPEKKRINLAQTICAKSFAHLSMKSQQ